MTCMPKRCSLSTTRAQALSPRACAALFAVFLMLILWPAASHAVRIKDMADLKGVRTNQLVGYGLVIGLDGTGDGDAQMTVQTLSNMLEKMGRHRTSR
jgi:flagellar P-ring protein precursor FlgI